MTDGADDSALAGIGIAILRGQRGKGNAGAIV